MPAAQRFDQSIQPSRATRAAAATIAAVGVTLLGVAAVAPASSTATESGGFKGIGKVAPHKGGHVHTLGGFKGMDW